MNFEEIDIEQTHIRLTTDVDNHGLKNYIYDIRRQLKQFIQTNVDFSLTLEPITIDIENAPLIVKTMQKASQISDVGPMASVAGTISELCINYLIKNDSKYSIVENGGDIAIINDTKVLCGIYSNNNVLGNNIAFEIKPKNKAMGICTSSGKIGHSISFGVSDSVTVIAKSPSIADSLATRIANDVNGKTSEDKVINAIETAEDYREYFRGVLIISNANVGTVGRLPKIVESEEFEVKV